MFSKQTERCPQGKKITLTSKVWLEVLQHLSKIKEARAAEKELRLPLVGEKYLILEKFAANGLWYTGIHDLTKAGSIIPFSGLNFDDKEWDMLLSNIDLINNLLKVGDNRGSKRSVDGTEVSCGQITMYKWKWLLGKKKIKEGTATFYSEGDCRHEGKKHEPQKGTDYSGEKVPSLVIEKITTDPPCKMLLMREVYIAILRGEIRKLIEGNCEGCKIESGSQVDHMGENGCLVEEANYYNTYCTTARSKIQVGSVVMMFDAARKEMKIRPLYGMLLAEGVHYYLSDETCIELMGKPDANSKELELFLDGIYENLFARK